MRRIRANGYRPAEPIGMICVLAIVSLSACASPELEVRAKIGSRDASDQEAGSYYAKGKSELANARFGLAVRDFGLALSRNPASVEILNALAVSYDRLGRYDLAMRYFRKALAIDPRSVQTINNIGYTYYRRGEARLAANFLARIGGMSSTNRVVAGNFRLARAAMQSRGSQCRAVTEGPLGSPSAPRFDADRPQRKLRIVPIGSRVQRLVIDADQVDRPVNADSGKTAAKRSTDRTHGPRSAVSAAAPVSGQTACSSLGEISGRRSNAAGIRMPSLDRRPEAASTAVSNGEIELPVDLTPELIELEPELFGPIGSDYQNEST